MLVRKQMMRHLPKFHNSLINQIQMHTIKLPVLKTTISDGQVERSGADESVVNAPFS